MQVVEEEEEEEDILPRFSLESQKNRCHRRQHRRPSSCCGLPISPFFSIEGLLFPKTSSYVKLPHHPLNLTIRKLDGSSFDVEVAKMATVAELKLAVESVFSHMPREGLGKISWSHVWGQFCLCYDGWKLLDDSEHISNYGVNDGDQLHFVRHVSINYNLIRRRSKETLSTLEQPRISDGFVEREQDGEKDDSSDDQENLQDQHYDDGDEDIMTRYELKLARLFGMCFSFRRLGSPGRRFESNSFSSRLAHGFMGSFRSIVRLCSSNKLNSERDPLEEV